MSWSKYESKRRGKMNKDYKPKKKDLIEKLDRYSKEQARLIKYIASDNYDPKTKKQAANRLADISERVGTIRKTINTKELIKNE